MVLCSNKTCSYIKLSFLIAYLSLAISLEFFYRTPLFDLSLTFEQYYYSITSNTLIFFFKIITIFGTQAIILPILFIVFLTFPLTKSYTLLSIVFLANYFDNILKIVYGSQRPFWVCPSLKRECDIGYGNPSGHSFSSISVYLSLWHIITDFKCYTQSCARIAMKYFLLVALILLCIAIIISRLYLSVHSINQVLYGATLGFALYYYFFHVLSMNKFTIRRLIEYITSKTMIVVHGIKFTLFLVLLMLAYGFIEHDNDEYDSMLSELCPNVPLYRKYNNNGCYIGLTLLMLIGGHYGLMALIYYCKFVYPQKEEMLNEWNRGNIRLFAYKVCIGILFASLLILVGILPKDMSLYIIFLFKGAIPYLVTGFMLFFPFIITCIKCKIANPMIYDICIKAEGDGDGEIAYTNPNDKNPIPQEDDVEIEIKIQHNSDINGNTNNNNNTISK